LENENEKKNVKRIKNVTNAFFFEHEGAVSNVRNNFLSYADHSLREVVKFLPCDGEGVGKQ